MVFLDARIPVVLLDHSMAPAGTDAVLAETGAIVAAAALLERFAAAPTAWHRLDCACCGGVPTPAGLALRRLFLRRVAGSAWFTRVVVVPVSAAGAAGVLAALEQDAFVQGRFRVG